MLSFLPCFVRPTINLTGGRFTTGKVLSASMLSFVNRITGIWYAPYFINSDCAAKETSVDVFSTSFSLHNSVALLYCNSMSHSHIIFAVRCYITNWYCNNSSRHLCTTWGTLASESNLFSVHCNCISHLTLLPTNTF